MFVLARPNPAEIALAHEDVRSVVVLKIIKSNGGSARRFFSCREKRVSPQLCENAIEGRAGTAGGREREPGSRDAHHGRFRLGGRLYRTRKGVRGIIMGVRCAREEGLSLYGRVHGSDRGGGNETRELRRGAEVGDLGGWKVYYC